MEPNTPYPKYPNHPIRIENAGLDNAITAQFDSTYNVLAIKVNKVLDKFRRWQALPPESRDDQTLLEVQESLESINQSIEKTDSEIEMYFSILRLQLISE